MREIGLPWSPALIERARRSVGATVCAARAALHDGVAAQLAAARTTRTPTTARVFVCSTTPPWPRA
jgi:acetoin utilization deacetylase AcuC-like enzyme